MRSHFKLYLSLSFLIIACIGGDLLDCSEHWLTPIQKNVCLLRLLSFSLFNSSFVSLVWRLYRSSISLKVGKVFGAIPAMRSAFAWWGYTVSILTSSSVLLVDVSLPSLFSTPVGIARKVDGK